MIFKKILKSKQGIAIENAIVFMLVIFLLCALLTGLTLIGHFQVKTQNQTLQIDVEIDQIGEDYLSSVKANEDFTKDYENYTYKVEGNALTVWHKNDQTETVLLYVEADLTVDDTLNVTKWRYSLPR